MATEKQVNYALFLLRERGFSVNFMDSRFKELGASMRERKGRVKDWLEAMNTASISAVIDRLKEIVPR